MFEKIYLFSIISYVVETWNLEDNIKNSFFNLIGKETIFLLRLEALKIVEPRQILLSIIKTNDNSWCMISIFPLRFYRVFLPFPLCSRTGFS